MSKSTQWLGNNNLYSDTKVNMHSSANEVIQVMIQFMYKRLFYARPFYVTSTRISYLHAMNPDI